jgi:hypothetical protein
MLKEDTKRELLCPRCNRLFQIAEQLYQRIAKPVFCYRCHQYLKVKARIAAEMSA